MPTEITEIQINERGDETHESWLLIRANSVFSGGGGTRLFDSEIPHSHYIFVEIARCTRRRDLNHDYLHSTDVLVRMSMSQAQWGAFVSSFGNGSGVPATLDFLTGVGAVPQAPGESRFDQSHQEVRDAGTKALATVQESYDQLAAAFESGTKHEQREALRDLGIRLRNAPLNMEFAASSLTEHVESVVTKARADIEGMALSAMERGELTEPVAPFQLEGGEPIEEESNAR